MINLNVLNRAKTRLLSKTGSPALVALIGLMCLVASTGFLIALCFGWFVLRKSGIMSLPICFSDKCLGTALRVWQYPFYVLYATLNLLVAIATIGGIFVALLSYLHTTAATAFGNHISQLDVFQKYVDSEISKRSRVSPASVDIYHWYSIIFPDADSGVLKVSSQYESIVEDLADAILDGNLQSKSAVRGSFRYVKHQDRVVQALQRFGIKLDRQPRVEFFEIEDALFSLVRAVNFAFCGKSTKCILPKRDYR